MKDKPCKRKPKKPTGTRFYAMFAGVVLCFSAAVCSEEQTQTISLPDAVMMTLRYHPELQALVSQERVWQGRVEQAGTGERHQFSLMIEDALGTGENSAFNNMQSTLTFSWLLQQERLDSRVAAAKSEAATLALEKRIKALDLAALVARRFIAILVNQEHLKLNQIAVSQAKQVMKILTQRVKAGKNSGIEVQLAKAELIRQELALEDAEHQLKANRYQLASLWGKPAQRYPLSGNLLNLPAIPTVESQLALLRQNPRVLQFASAQRIAQSQIELARIEAKPQWQFTAGLRRYEATDDFGLVAGISIPWGDSNRNAGMIAALQAEQDVLASEQSALMQSLDTQLYVLLQEMAHSQHVIQTVQTSIVPTLETALSEAGNAFEKGQTSYNQYHNVRRELRIAHTQLLDAFESLHLQHIEIQRLTGTSLSQ